MEYQKGTDKSEREDLYNDQFNLNKFARPTDWQSAASEIYKFMHEERTKKEDLWNSITPAERSSLDAVSHTESKTLELLLNDNGKTPAYLPGSWLEFMTNSGRYGIGGTSVSDITQKIVGKIAAAIKQPFFFLPSDYAAASFKDFERLCDGHKNAYALLTNFGPNPPRGLYLHGGYGTGKTHLMSAFARGLLAELTIENIKKITLAAQSAIRQLSSSASKRNVLYEVNSRMESVKNNLSRFLDSAHSSYMPDYNYKTFSEAEEAFSKLYEENRKHNDPELSAIYKSDDAAEAFKLLSKLKQQILDRKEVIRKKDRSKIKETLRELFEVEIDDDNIDRLYQGAERKSNEEIFKAGINCLIGAHKKVGQLIKIIGDKYQGYGYSIGEIVDHAWQQASESHPYHPTDIAFITFDAFFDRREDEAFVKDFLGRKVLIIDDINSKEDKARMDFIQRIVEYRYNEVRTGATFITSNSSPEALLQVKDYPKQISERIHSRLMEMCMPIHFDAPDYRLKIASEANDKLMDLVKKIRQED